MNLTRRELMRKGAAAAVLLGATPVFAGPAKKSGIVTPRDYLNELVYTRKEVDDWFAGKAFPFCKYHGEFGWLLNSGPMKDGVDKSVSMYTYVGEDGERLMSNYSDKPCRINTYGDSFTQCHQVSDHETWQETLAAHLQEPVRNFGIGGWSFYQAYLRMLKEEARTPASHIIFNIYEDDHRRNLDSWRNIRRKKYELNIEPTLPYVEVNAEKETFVERPNLCPTKESFYQLCDPERVYEMFKDDFALQIMVAHRNARSKNPNLDYSEFAKMSMTHGIETTIENSATLAEAANALHERSALFSSQKIVEKIEEFAKQNNKKVLYVLSGPAAWIARRVEEGTRWDQTFVDFLKAKGLPFVDLMEAHVEEFKQYQIGVKEYLRKYFIGHYNPTGNHFCAFAIKNKLVEMLDPKPFPYQ